MGVVKRIGTGLRLAAVALLVLSLVAFVNPTLASFAPSAGNGIQLYQDGGTSGGGTGGDGDATGGDATGADATGGDATGGNSGGSSGGTVGGDATGGSTTGGNATGGNSTGGNAGTAGTSGAGSGGASGAGSGGAAGAAGNSAFLSWDAAPADASHGAPTGYRIYHADSPSGAYSVLAEVGNVTSFTAKDLSSGTHCFSVKAFNPAGESATAGCGNGDCCKTIP